MRSLSLWRRTLSLHMWTCNLLPLHYKMKHWAGYLGGWKLNIFEVKCCWNLVFLIEILWGEITYLFDLIWKSVRLVKVKEILVSNPGKSLYNIKAPKGVKFFYFKVNTNKFIFLNKLCFMVYFMDSLITIMNMIYDISYAGVIWCVLVYHYRFSKGKSFEQLKDGCHKLALDLR